MGFDWFRGVVSRSGRQPSGCYTGEVRASSIFTDATDVQVEIDTSSPLIKCVLRGIVRSQAELGVRAPPSPPPRSLEYVRGIVKTYLHHGERGGACDVAVPEF